MDAKAETKPMGRVTRIDEARAGHHLGEKLGGTVEQASPALRDGEAELPAASWRRRAAPCGRSDFGHRPASRAREVGHRREALRVRGTPATAEAAAAVIVGGPRRRRPGPAAADAFPDRTRTRIRIDYSPERRMRDIPRRTGALGAFPDSLPAGPCRSPTSLHRRDSPQVHGHTAAPRAPHRSIRSRRCVSDSAQQSGRQPRRHPRP